MFTTLMIEQGVALPFCPCEHKVMSWRAVGDQKEEASGIIEDEVMGKSRLVHHTAGWYGALAHEHRS